ATALRPAPKRRRTATPRPARPRPARPRPATPRVPTPSPPALPQRRRLHPRRLLPPRLPGRTRDGPDAPTAPPPPTAVKKYLIAGLLVWLPLVVTVWVLQAALGMLNGIF